MESGLESVGGGNGATDKPRTPTGSVRSLAMNTDEEAKAGRSSETPIPPGTDSYPIPDANTLKKRLHNLFQGGSVYVRNRQENGGTASGSSASLSPIMTGSPPDWTVGESSLSPFFSSRQSSLSGKRPVGRSITLEEELQQRLAEMGDAVRSWQARWRQERDDNLRLTEHLNKCEIESKRIIDALTAAYNKKNKILEDTLIKTLKNVEQLMIERSALEGRLQQSKEIIDLQRQEIEKEFARAHGEVGKLRDEVEKVQGRSAVLESENQSMKEEKRILSDELQMFTKNTKNFNSSIKEAELRSELYKTLLDLAIEKLRMAEDFPPLNIPEETPPPVTSRPRMSGRYVLRVNSKDPTRMHVEDTFETRERQEATNNEPLLESDNASETSLKGAASEVKTRDPGTGSDDVSNPKVIQRSISDQSSAQDQTHQFLGKTEVPYKSLTKSNETGNLSRSPSEHTAASIERVQTDHNRSNVSSSDPKTTLDDEKAKPGKKPRKFSFGKDSMKPRNLIRQLSGGSKSDSLGQLATAHSQKNDVSLKQTKSSSNVLHHTQETHSTSKRVVLKTNQCDERHVHCSGTHTNPLANSSTGHTGNDASHVTIATNARRLRSLSDSEDVQTPGKQLLAGDIAKDLLMADSDKNDQMRHRSRTLDSTTEKPHVHKLRSRRSRSRQLLESNTSHSSNEELASIHMSSCEGLRGKRNGITDSSKSSGLSKQLKFRGTITRDFSELLKVFSRDQSKSEDLPGKESSKGNGWKKTKGGK